MSNYNQRIRAEAKFKKEVDDALALLEEKQAFEADLAVTLKNNSHYQLTGKWGATTGMGNGVPRFPRQAQLQSCIGGLAIKLAGMPNADEELFRRIIEACAKYGVELVPTVTQTSIYKRWAHQKRVEAGKYN